MSEGETRRTRRDRRPTTTALLLVAALSIGLLIGFGPGLLADGSQSQQTSMRVDRQRSVQGLDLPGAAKALSATEVLARLRDTTKPARSNSPTALAAATAFFDAQVAGDQDAAYAALSDADRTTYSTAAVWRERRHQMLPDVLEYKLGNVAATRASVATVQAELRLRPGLDETIGLVPASATLSLRVVLEHGYWRVGIQRSPIDFSYLSARTLPHAVNLWIQARQRCETRQQWRSTLYGEGAEAHAQSLCKRSGSIEFSAPKAIAGRPDTASLVAAFGPEVGLWARVVSVREPRTFDLVLAPVDQQWLVIGVLTNPSSLGQG